MAWRIKHVWPNDSRIGKRSLGGVAYIFRNKVVVFVCALLAGVFFAFVWRKYEETLRINYTLTRYFPEPYNYEALYTKWLKRRGLQRVPIEQVSPATASALITEQEFLAEQVPVLCVILTKENKRAKAIRNTWAQHCNIAVFYGSRDDEVVPVSRLPNTAPWPHLCGSLLRAWKRYRKEFQWVMVVDDQTYVLVENLRYLVAALNPDKVHYLGHPMRDSQTGQLYNSASAGYAINHKLLESFVSHVSDDDVCDHFTSYCATADCILGTLLQQFGASPVDTRDNLGRGRFNSFNPHDLLIPKSISVFNHYWTDSVYLSSEGEDCCSDYSVTFHNVRPAKMWLMEYTAYHLRPHFYGTSGSLTTKADNPNLPVTDKILQKEVKGKLEENIGEAIVKDLGEYGAKTKPRVSNLDGSDSIEDITEYATNPHTDNSAFKTTINRVKSIKGRINVHPVLDTQVNSSTVPLGDQLGRVTPSYSTNKVSSKLNRTMQTLSSLLNAENESENELDNEIPNVIT